MLGDGEEDVGAPSRADRVHCHLNRAESAVLEADRARQPRGQLTVDLALRSARTDRPPANQVSDILRGDRVQVLRPRWKIQIH